MMDGMENIEATPLPSFQIESRRLRGKYPKTCISCGGEFLVPKAQLHQKTCSMKCYGHTQRVYIPKVCLQCGGVAPVVNGNPRIFCDRACFMKYNTKERHPRWISDKERICVVCGVSVSNPQNTKNPTCSMKCHQEWVVVHGRKHRAAVGTVRKLQQGHMVIKLENAHWNRAKLSITATGIKPKTALKTFNSRTRVGIGNFTARQRRSVFV
jgi:hypothetical protein